MKIEKNVLCFYSSNGRLRTSESEKPRTLKDDLKAVLEKLGDVRVALLGVDLAIAHYKGEGEISITEPPAILDDPEFFEEPEGDPSGE